MTVKSYYKLFLLIAGTIGAIYIAYQIRSIIILLFIVLIISSTLKPFVERLEKHKIPRTVSAIGLLVLVVIGASALTFSLASSIIEQYSTLADSLVSNTEILAERYNVDQYFGEELNADNIRNQFSNIIRSNFQNAASSIFNFGATVFGGLFTIFTALTILFYLLYDHDKVKRFVIGFAPEEKQKNLDRIYSNTEKRLSHWLRGQLQLVLIMSIIASVAFLIIGIEFAIPLGILVGVLDFIPVVGPLIAFIPVVLIAAVSSPGQALIVAIFFVLLQQFESNFLVPRIMSQSVGLDPIAVIIALMIGSTLGQIMGAILAVPTAVIVMIIYEEWRNNIEARKKQK
jgi:predicted PurR-regulated permease PerM